MASMSIAFFLLVLYFTVAAAELSRKMYIVHMKHHDKPSSYATHRDWYAASLRSLTSATAEADSRLLYSYTEAYHGFAASLSADEAESLRQSDSVLGVYEDTVYSLHTTRTPEFLGISSDLGLWDPHSAQGGQNRARAAAAASDVIIGVLDTGVWPESRSFDDSGMSAVPTRWRGQCEAGPDFNPKLCNRKLIGARHFSKGYFMALGEGFLKKPEEAESPRDHDGHGTHTASTAAGSQVTNASLLGYASGTARGMAIHARIASYKVCWVSGCYGSDILGAIDQAIVDGVDVLSMSLGGSTGPYYRDTIAIGAFTAMERGIFVSCSAGNSGPTRNSLTNHVPLQLKQSHFALGNLGQQHMPLQLKQLLAFTLGNLGQQHTPLQLKQLAFTLGNLGQRHLNLQQWLVWHDGIQ
ncbi:hypothetical protein SAY87_009706 [Trapa incisa]|uniref:Uncharacterized protein n=1 Tax=Trapa incisa TaxID=236973 RepID=A0AAN7JYU6_9MYRT|nr:hypothetical protein SAY87_009706 [Trapa incisa]